MKNTQFTKPDIKTALKHKKRWEGGSGLGTRVYSWRIHVDVWQNQYNIIK